MIDANLNPLQPLYSAAVQLMTRSTKPNQRRGEWPANKNRRAGGTGESAEQRGCCHLFLAHIKSSSGLVASDYLIYNTGKKNKKKMLSTTILPDWNNNWRRGLKPDQPQLQKFLGCWQWCSSSGWDHLTNHLTHTEATSSLRRNRRCRVLWGWCSRGTSWLGSLLRPLTSPRPRPSHWAVWNHSIK